MPLMPKRVKYRKIQRRRAGRLKGVATRTNKVNFGDFGLKSLETSWITARQIEACRITAMRVLKGVGDFYIRVFPWKSYTKKPIQTGMGGGKGDPSGDSYVAIAKPGTILFEIGGVDEEEARRCFAMIANKLPVKTMMIKR